MRAFGYRRGRIHRAPISSTGLARDGQDIAVADDLSARAGRNLNGSAAAFHRPPAMALDPDCWTRLRHTMASAGLRGLACLTG
jgi:hypothetical protein